MKQFKELIHTCFTRAIHDGRRFSNRLTRTTLTFCMGIFFISGIGFPIMLAAQQKEAKYNLGPQLIPSNSPPQTDRSSGGVMPIYDPFTGTLNTSCANSNFTQGDWSNWTGCYGYGTNPPLPSCTNIGFLTSPTGGNYTEPLHKMMAAPGYHDYWGCDTVRTVFTGESFSARIGDTATGRHGAEVHYEVYVNSTNYLFVYRYAVVLESPSHSVAQQPNFQVVIRDSVGNTLDPVCGYYYIAAPTTANTPPPGWVYCINPGNRQRYAKPWTTVAMDLTPYVGRHITLAFIAKGCCISNGSHRGYAFVSAYCSALIIQTALCQGDTVATLTAPPGFAHYLWSTGDTTQSITVQHPVTNSTYSVLLTGVNGCSVILNNTLTYTVITTDFTHGSVCQNQPTQFTDASFVNQNSVVNWRWNFGDGTPVVNGIQNPPHTFTGLGPYNVKLVSYSTEGCRDSITHSISVSPMPTASITGTVTVCKSTTPPLITFTGASASAPYIFAYRINGGAVQYITTTSGNSVTVAAPTNTVGTYIYSLVNVTEGSVQACTQAASGTATVTVNPAPTATISGNTTICQHAAAPLITFTGASGTAPYTFTYNINGGSDQTATTSSGNSVSIPVSTLVAGTFTYTLISVMDGGAVSCTNPQTGSVTVIINPLPTATISGTTDVCQNAASPFITFTGASSTQPYTFTYNINGGANKTVTTTSGNSITVAVLTGTAGTFTYNLISVQDGSSTACSQGQTGSATVTVNPLPTAAIAGTIAVCQNATDPLVTFTGASSTAPYTFTYNINGGSDQVVTTTSGNSITIAAPTNIVGTFNYNLTSVTDGSSTLCSQAQAGIATITVNPLPTATINGTTDVCQNATAPLITFTGAGASTPYTFTYNINGGASLFVTTSSGNSVTVTAPTSTAGTFVYNLLNVHDGSSTACSQAQAGSATINVNPLPTATISGNTSVCQNSAAPMVTFTGASSMAPYTFTYKINGGANQIITTTSGNSISIAAPTNVVGTFVYSLVSVQDGSSTVCSQSQSGTATVIVNPLPTATIAGTIAVCQNATAPLITFTGAAATAPYTFTYDINGGSAQTVTTTSGNSITIAAPTNVVGSFTYNLLGVQDASSTACSQPQSGSATVTVNPLPTASILGTTAVCQNSASPLITFTGASASAPYTFTYKINGGANLFVSTTSGNSVSISAPTNLVGTFVYSLVSVQDGSSTSCSQPQAGSATVTVNPLPTANISGTTSVCQNAASPLITFTGASATAPYTFTYKLNGGTDQTITTTSGNSVTIAAPTNAVGTFTYSLVSVQEGSGTACSQLQSGSATITVNPLPTASISGTTTVCKNSTAPLITFTGASASAPYTFTYNINGGASQIITTVSGNSVTIAAPTNIVGSFTYNLLSVQDGSSTTCSQAQGGSATVIVNPLPTASISGTTTVCQNSTAPVITFTGASATAPYTFTYNINGGASQFISTTSGNSVTLAAPTNVPGTFNYNLLSVQDGSTTACIQAQAGIATVIVNPLPTAAITGTTSVCLNSTPPLITFTGALATAPYTFTYNINGGANQQITTTSGNSVTIAAPTNTLGTFTYNLVSVQDGSSTACFQAQSGSATVTVNLLPTATVTGTTQVCNNSAPPLVTFTGASTSPPYTFTYNINGGSSQFITTTSGSSVSIPAPTGTVGTFNYNLLFIQDGSLYPCAQAQTGTATITVNPLPTASISGTTTVCQNANSPLVTFTGASATAPYTFTYKVNGGANQVVTTSSGNSVTIAAPTNVVGTFIYTLVSVQDGSTTACSQAQAGSATIIVNPLPTATISGTTAVCRNAASPLITFTGASASAPYTFTYNINGGANQVISTTAGNSVTLPAPTSTAGTFNYNLVSVQDGSSTTCSQAQSGSATVIVNPLPTAAISGATTVCESSTAPLITFTGASASAPYTFTYNINGGPSLFVTTSSGNSVNVTAPTNVPGTFTYNLLSVQDGSTTACIQAQSGTATVVVHPLPTATISGTTSVCLNSFPPLITFTGASASAPYTFTYNINGGANQQITTVSGNSITISAPTNALGSFNYNLVSVQDGSSTTCVQAQAGTATVTVNLLPTATISGTTSVCFNGTPPLVTFTGASTSPPYTFTYNINGGASQLITTTSGSSVTLPAPTSAVGNFTYNLISVQDGSLYTCSQAQSGSATITVNPLPTATISGTNSVCQNSTAPLITFTGASSTAPYTFTYNINGGANLVITTTSGNSVTLPAPTSAAGTFTYNLLSVQDGSITACSQPQSGSATIIVAPLPTATISGTVSVCLNSPPPPVTFTGATSTAPYTFTYNINGGANQVVTTTSGNTATILAPTGTLGTFTYNLVSVQDGNGLACSQAQTGSATVTVNLLPTATVSGTTNVCLNGTAPLVTFTGASTSPPYTFTYNINGGASQFVTTSSGNSVTVAAPTNVAGPFTYNLLFVQDGSPTTCQQAQNGSATITVNQLPTASISGTTTVCQNSASPLVTFTGSTTSPPYTFTYNINGGANQIVTTSGGNSSVTVSAPTGIVGSFIYNLVSVKDGTPQACSQSQSGSATVLVTSLPTATVSGTTSVCLNSTPPLIIFTGASATAPYTFTYKINGGANQVITTSSGNSVTVAAPTNVLGTFTYSLVSVQDGSALGCSQAQAGSASVTINPLPYVNFSVCNDLITTTTSRTFKLKGGLPPGGQYYIDGVPAAGGLFNPTVLSASNHQVTYSFTDFNTCMSTSSSVFINVISGSASGSCPQSFTDPRDNYVYKAFTIGSRCWMLTNLNYGTKLPSVSQVQSDNCTPEKYCLSSDANCTTYGGLYQWDELMQYQVPASGLTVQGMCPPEWHIPTQAEWTDLINSVTSTTPGDGLAGSYLKDPVPTFGFRTLLGGILYQNNNWDFISGNLTATMFWTATTDGPYRSIARGMNIYTYSVSFYPSIKSNAFSVRCVKD